MLLNLYHGFRISPLETMLHGRWKKEVTRKEIWWTSGVSRTTIDFFASSSLKTSSCMRACYCGVGIYIPWKIACHTIRLRCLRRSKNWEIKLLIDNPTKWDKFLLQYLLTSEKTYRHVSTESRNSLIRRDSVTRLRHSEHDLILATVMHTTIYELGETMFSVGSTPRLYLRRQMNNCKEYNWNVIIHYWERWPWSKFKGKYIGINQQICALPWKLRTKSQCQGLSVISGSGSAIYTVQRRWVSISWEPVYKISSSWVDVQIFYAFFSLVSGLIRFCDGSDKRIASNLCRSVKCVTEILAKTSQAFEEESMSCTL
jgi:hypothetical protein